MQRIRLINSIQKMMRIQNNCPEFNYTFLQRYSKQQLQEMMTGWQQKQPELFNTNGLYIMWGLCKECVPQILVAH